MASLCFLKQTEFGANCAAGFRELRQADELLDATLACEGEAVRVHKLVLSASSAFFRRVVSQAGVSTQPYIFLRGLASQDLLNIIAFIYDGEARVPADQLTRFIQAAQELEIKGLGPDQIKGANPNLSKSIKRESQASNDSNTSSLSSSSLKRKKPKLEVLQETPEEPSVSPGDFPETSPLSDKSNLYEIVGNGEDRRYSFDGEFNRLNNTLTEMKKAKIERIKKLKESIDDQYNPNDTLDSILPQTNEADDTFEQELQQQESKKQEIQGTLTSNDSAMVDSVNSEQDQETQINNEVSKITEKIENPDDPKQKGIWKCKVCNKTSKRVTEIKEHAEIHLTGFSHKCKMCGRSYKTRSSLRQHLMLRHKC